MVLGGALGCLGGRLIGASELAASGYARDNFVVHTKKLQAAGTAPAVARVFSVASGLAILRPTHVTGRAGCAQHKGAVYKVRHVLCRIPLPGARVLSPPPASRIPLGEGKADVAVVEPSRLSLPCP